MTGAGETEVVHAEDIDHDEALAWAMEMRADARTRRRRSTTGDMLYRLYLLGILTMPLGYLLVGVLRETPRAGEAAIEALVDRVALVAPVALLAIGISALRLAAWTGPVVVARADISWLFSLPFDRPRMIRPRLRRAFIVAAIIGAVAGVLATIPYHLAVGLADDGAAEAARMALSGAVCGGLYLALLAGMGWLVEIRPRLARLLMRAGGPALALLAVVAAVGMFGPIPPPWERSIALASGPWGWLTTGVLASSSYPAVPWWVGLAGTLALLVAAGLVLRHARRRAGAVSLEELDRRAETSAQVTAAAVYLADFRGAAQARERAVRSLLGRSRLRLPMPHRRWMLTPWIGATILLRQGRRAGQALLWLLGATLLAREGVQRLAAAGPEDGPGLGLVLAVAAAAVAYPAAGTLIEPLRVEHEQRFGLRQLRTRPDRLALQHLVVPAVLVWLLSVVATGLLVTAGMLPAMSLAVAAAVSLVATPVLVAVAAFVMSGPPADSTWLYSGDSGLGRLALHLLRGPLITMIAIGVPLLASGAGSLQASSLLTQVAWAMSTVAVLGRLVAQRLEKHH